MKEKILTIKTLVLAVTLAGALLSLPQAARLIRMYRETGRIEQ